MSISSEASDGILTRQPRFPYKWPYIMVNWGDIQPYTYKGEPNFVQFVSGQGISPVPR